LQKQKPGETGAKTTKKAVKHAVLRLKKYEIGYAKYLSILQKRTHTEHI